jgi:hypothetical protein
MERFTNKKVVLFGLEDTYATDPTLAAADALQVMNLQMMPFQASMANRDFADAKFGAETESILQLYRTTTFDIFLSGSGDAGTAPLWGSVARACSMLETITADTKVEYTLLDGGPESAAMYFYLDGQRRKLLGLKGSLTPKFVGGQLAMASVAMSGLLVAADADAAFPTQADLRTAMADFVDALEVNKANTTFTHHGHSAVLHSLELQQGNAVAFRDRPNAAGIVITNRRSIGTLMIDAPTLTAKNYGSLFQTRATAAQQLVHGTVAGNIVQLDATAVQNGAPSDVDNGGVAGLSIPLLYTGRGDEWKLTVK